MKILRPALGAIATTLLHATTPTAVAESLALAPCPAENCVGHVLQTLGTPILLTKIDGPDSAAYGDAVLGVWTMRAFAVWDVSSVPDGAAVHSVTLVSQVSPSGDEAHVTEYRRLACDPRSAAAASLWDCLQDEVYASFSTGTDAGEHVTPLGGTAPADLQSAITTAGWFAVAIAEPSDANGAASLAGWQRARPELHVEYSTTTTVQVASWGRMKSAYR